MMPAWYQRMNPRERLLSWIVAGTVAVLLNLWILSSLWGAVASAQKEFGARRSKLAEQDGLRERARHLDEARRVDAAASAGAQRSSGSLCAA